MFDAQILLDPFEKQFDSPNRSGVLDIGGVQKFRGLQAAHERPVPAKRSALSVPLSAARA
jgi:hypothetical protein